MNFQKQRKYVFLGVCLLMCFSLFGCKSSAFKKNIAEMKAFPKGTMVLDYYEKVVGTPVEKGHDEIVLLIGEPGMVEIDVYHKPDGEDAVEECKKYQTEDKLIDEVYALVDKYELAKWEKMDHEVIDGRALVIQFRQNGRMQRVNSDLITKKYGTRPFGEVEAMLREAVKTATPLQ